MTPTTAAVPEFTNRRPGRGGALAWISAWCVLLTVGLD